MSVVCVEFDLARDKSMEIIWDNARMLNILIVHVVGNYKYVICASSRVVVPFWCICFIKQLLAFFNCSRTIWMCYPSPKSGRLDECLQDCGFQFT
jgi:hypothetical protein